MDALNARMKTLEEEIWKRSLPFPVLHDADDEIMAAWDVQLYPTVALLDPQGTLVRVHGVEDFEAKLRELSK